MISLMSRYSCPLPEPSRPSLLVWTCGNGTNLPREEITSLSGTCSSYCFYPRHHIRSRSASQQRVSDTATFFTRGYLSQGNYLTAPSSNRGTIISLPDSVNFTFANSLTPSSGCPAYSTGDTGSASSNVFRATYQNAIAKRLNKFLDGLTLNATDIGVMQDLCGFQAEVDGDTRFCNVFEGAFDLATKLL